MPKTWNGQGENNCSKGQTGGKKELQAYNSRAYGMLGSDVSLIPIVNSCHNFFTDSVDGCTVKKLT
jgi:hypothetical protein